MSGGAGRPDRAAVRAASKRSALRVAAWNVANVEFSESTKADLITTLVEMVDSGVASFGASVPTLTTLCTLIPSAPSPSASSKMRKLDLVRAMLVAGRAIGGTGMLPADGGILVLPTPGTDGRPAGVSSEDWEYMQNAIIGKRAAEAVRLEKFRKLAEAAALREGFSDTSSDDVSKADEVGVVGVGRNAMLFRYRSKETSGLSKREIFKGVSADIAAELVYVEKLKFADPIAVKAHYDELIVHLPMMIKRHSLSAVQLANPRSAFVKTLETFLARHSSWKSSGSVRIKRRVNKTESGKKRGRDSDSDSDAPAKKVPAAVPFARACKPVSEISSKLLRKGESLKSIFEEWRVSGDKILPYEALKFIGKEVASTRSDFYHPTRGVYNVFGSEHQVEARDFKLRNLFEDVVRKLVPSRQIRLNEYEAAEALRDRGGQLAKDIRRRREKSESKLLARLALDCELCMMGVKSGKAYDEALKGDGIAMAIRDAFGNSDASSDEEATVSRKLAEVAWKKASNVRITPQRAKKQNRKGQNSETKAMLDALRSGFASIRSSLANGTANGGWKDDGRSSNGRRNGSNQASSGNKGAGPCWHCGLDGHAQWEKAKCKLAGQAPAPGSEHEKRNGAGSGSGGPGRKP